MVSGSSPDEVGLSLGEGWSLGEGVGVGDGSGLAVEVCVHV